MAEELRPDVQAYLVKAAENIAKQQNFVPESMEQMADWMHANHIAICQEARNLQDALLEKLTKHQDRVTRILSTRVWATVQRQELARKEVAAYNAALE